MGTSSSCRRASWKSGRTHCRSARYPTTGGRAAARARAMPRLVRGARRHYAKRSAGEASGANLSRNAPARTQAAGAATRRSANPHGLGAADKDPRAAMATPWLRRRGQRSARCNSPRASMATQNPHCTMCEERPEAKSNLRCKEQLKCKEQPEATSNSTWNDKEHPGLHGRQVCMATSAWHEPECMASRIYPSRQCA